MKNILIIMSLFLSWDCFSQVQWQKCLGGSDIDFGQSVQQTFDGGYIIAGYSSSTDGDLTLNKGYEDIWVVKLSASGNIQWQKSFGGSADDVGGYISQTADSGYILSGTSSSNDADVSGNHGANDYWIVKLSSSGNIQWQKCFGGSAVDVIESIQQTSDGGYIAAGFSHSTDGNVSGNHGGEDYWVLKLSSLGTLEWQKSYGGSNNEQAKSILQTSDGGYIVVGSTTSSDGDVSGNHGGLDCWALKLSAIGNIQWQKCYGGTNLDEAFSVSQTFEGGYILAGNSKSNDGDVTGNHGSYDCWIVKLSASGTIEWQKSFGGSNSDGATIVQQTSDGDYFITGGTYSIDGDVTSNHGNNDFWVVKLNNSGNLQWQKCFGSENQEAAQSIRQTSDGGFILVGYAFGNGGDVTGYHTMEDIWVVKLGSKTSINDIDIKIISISPNPVADIIQINGITPTAIRIYNVSGQLVKEVVDANNISIANLPPAMYFVRLFDSQGLPIYQGKIIKS